mmetsp:Transcript_11824/g.13008  ORF Transcript_11824/g.13008 Transcript_11824/m.13008 type:complete len:196 (+) Transcript_11824:49-636(+)
MTDPTPIKHVCTLAGILAVGKTSAVHSYVTGTVSFPHDYVPTIYGDDLIKNCDKELDLIIRDTAGRADYTPIRHKAYKDASVVLLCFCVGNSRSLDSIISKWHEEVKSHAPDALIVVVGMQSDLRDDEEFKKAGIQCVNPRDAKDVCREVGACLYLECSSKDIPSVNRLFERVKNIATNPPKSLPRWQKGECAIQ